MSNNQNNVNTSLALAAATVVGTRFVPTGDGGALPVVDYQGVAADRQRLDPDNGVGGGVLVHERLAPVYKRQAGAPPLSMALVAAGLLLDAGARAQDVTGSVSALATAFELLFPGFCARVGWEGTVTAAPVELPEVFRYFARGYAVPVAGAPPVALDVAGLGALMATDEFIDIGWVAYADRSTSVRMIDVYGCLASLLYATHKGVSNVNAISFTTRRPAAAAAATGQTALPAVLVPDLDTYRWFGAILSAPSLRYGMMTELVRWMANPGASPAQTVTVSQIRMARRSGLGGFDMAELAMTNYGSVLRRVSALRHAIVGYEEHARALSRLVVPNAAYRHLIYGPNADNTARMDYSDLVMIGKEIKRTTAATLVNFGRDLPQVIKDEIVRAARVEGVTIVGIN
jgi:hypothetical protein